MATTVPPPMPTPPPPDPHWGDWGPPAAAAAAQRNRGRVFAVLTLIGGGFVALGSFIPWVTLLDTTNTVANGSSLSLTGMSMGLRGDGPYALGIGIAVLCIGVIRLAGSINSFWQRVPILLGILAGWVAVIDLNGIAAWSYPGTIAFAEPGLYVLFVGAVVTVIGASVVTLQEKS